MMAEVRPIHPMHRSMNGSQFWTRAPARMKVVEIPDDLKMDITKIALSIFTDCVNSGKTFQDSILAVYLSGLDHGRNSGEKDGH
jgi:hypothetical protein